MWIRFGRLGFAQIIYQVLITLIFWLKCLDPNSTIFLVSFDVEGPRIWPFRQGPMLRLWRYSTLRPGSTWWISSPKRDLGRREWYGDWWSTDHGFCSHPMRKAKFLAELKGRRFRLIPRCVITQANGKQRIIDDAAQEGQSELSADQNKLVLCTPLRPAQHIAAVAAAMPEELWSYCRHSDRWLGAGEDWPQAYRHSPISFDEALACVVVFWHDEWQEPAFQIYSSLLFGPPLAVTSFNRYSRFAEATWSQTPQMSGAYV